MKSERLGLLLVLASLIAIGVIVGILFVRQAASHDEQIRIQGVALTRALTGMGYEQLVPPSRQNSVLLAIVNTSAKSDLGYALVTGPSGAKLVEATSPGTLVPSLALTPEPSAWFGERKLISPGDGRKIREFYGPILKGGVLAGFVRLGFFEAGLLPGAGELSFFALLALPVFLLAPLFYLLIKREMKPLHQINRQLHSHLQTNASSLHTSVLSPSLELHDFIERFNRFMHLTDLRVRGFEAEQTATMTANRMLSYKKDKIEAILQALPDAVLVLDEAGQVTFANTRIEALFQVVGNNILGRPLQEWCKDAEILGYLMRHQNRPAQAYKAESLQFSAPAAPDRRIAAYAYPLFSAQDASRAAGTLIAFRDVTEELLVRRAGADFVASVSHELKTPLNTLSLYSEMLLTDDGKSAALRIEATNTIVDEVQRMTGLINNLLNISKIETSSITLERQRIRLDDLLRDTLENVAHSASAKGIVFDLKLPHGLSPIVVDKDLFRIAVNNLLTNAIKYNKPGGTVALVAEDSDGEIALHVQDTGIGIEQAEQARIFDKFFRGTSTDASKRGGHGLGLFLAKEIIEMHHGRLSVQSELGKGAQFTIRLKKTPLLVKEAIAA
jgi:signal transduction histidine kinase